MAKIRSSGRYKLQNHNNHEAVQQKLSETQNNLQGAANLTLIDLMRTPRQIRSVELTTRDQQIAIFGS